MASEVCSRTAATAIRLPVIHRAAEPPGPQPRDGLRSAPPELASIQQQLHDGNGRRFWRSLEELAETPQFQAYLHREFPENASEIGGRSRRGFLKFMGASLGLAGLTGCEIRPPRELIVPTVHVPNPLGPGTPLYFCTAHEFAGWGTGLVVQSRMGRPVKVEGNPRHPASRGATGIFPQAATLELYDPDRARTVTEAGNATTPASLRRHLGALAAEHDGDGGQGLRIVTTRTSSPTFDRLATALQQRWPAARWHAYDAVSADHQTAGKRLAWGDSAASVEPIFRFERAAVVLSLGADFLAARETPAAWVGDFAAARRVAPRPAQRSPSQAVGPRANSGAGGTARPTGEAPAENRADDDQAMLRLYAIDSLPTLTSAKADHHLTLSPIQMIEAARYLAAELQVLPSGDPLPVPAWTEHQRHWLEQCAADLRKHRAAGAATAEAAPAEAVPAEAVPAEARPLPLVIAGREQPPVLHALVHAINEALGAAGRTVQYVETRSTVGGETQAEPSERPTAGSLLELTNDMAAGRVQTLIILDGNPAFDAPADVPFAQALQRVPQRLHLSTFRNETSALCRWHVPQSHFLESWGDTRAFDGTASIVQPLIAPLYDSMTSIEFLAQLIAAEDPTGMRSARPDQRTNGEATPPPPVDPASRELAVSDVDGYELVRQTWHRWTERHSDVNAPAFDDAWQQWLRDGVIDGTRFAGALPRLRQDFAAAIATELNQLRARLAAAHAGERRSADRQVTEPQEWFDVVFRPDPNIWDGRFANNGWLQELPKPLTKLTWDNVAWIAVEDAERLRLVSGDLVRLGEGDQSVEIPVWVMPRQARGVLTVFFGYGRERGGRVAAGTGFNVYPLRSRDRLWTAHRVLLQPTGKSFPLASTQHHHLMNERHLVRTGTWDELRQNPQAPDFVGASKVDVDASFYPPWPESQPKWGMTIDLTACTGCSACVIACQAENNIPVVGKQEVLANRELHWMRVDTYYSGPSAAPQHVHHQPVPCMHCELAPCEVVCPVAATSHSEEGLNQMIYNRCVGTRYCSNNCPYKVRRFNFFDYSARFIDAPSLQLLPNPEVTVRSRGVMEKCTYCVQRIKSAEIAAQLEDRPLRDGHVITACQQVCPAKAIAFGDLADRRSEVHQLHEHPLNYALLEELNTRPRTTYLAEVTNPLDALRHA